jgi:hypothetical protein
MRATHILGLLLGFGTLGIVSAAGCGSTKLSAFDDPDATAGPGGEGGGPIFGKGEAAAACQGLQCQQKTCSGGGDTTVTGTVFAPNGKLALYNAIVYVPNTTPDPLVRGATCDKCGAVTGSPVVSAITDSHGKFELKNVPIGKNIPLVIQIGKWRRQVTIPAVAECTETKLTDPELTRLPKKQSEGDMPQIALTTGGCDLLGCMLPKIGIDPSEFGVEADGPSKAVHTYIGGGGFGSAPGPNGAPAAETLWGDLAKLKKYDLTILSCECTENLGNKGGSMNGAPFAVMSQYLEAGGRIFTTDFSYTWYRYAGEAALKSSANWRGGAPRAGSPLMFDSTFPKGQALVDWLSFVGATPNPGQLTPDIVWGNINTIDHMKSQIWANSGPQGSIPAGERVFTVNVPVGAPVDQQCGKGVHIDAHINNPGGAGSDKVDATYPASCNQPIKPGENLLAFFFFDLASCIQNDKEPPKPPVVK